MTVTPMQYHFIPNFCGGRILTNFFYYKPDQFDLFVQNLIKVTGTTENRGNIGVIVAFTNSQQEVAAGFLERLGFKPVATTDKFGNYDREDKKIMPGNSSPCITFVGDWYYDVLPAIKKYLEEREAQRATAPVTSNLRRPAGPPVTAAQAGTLTFYVGMYVRTKGRNTRQVWQIVESSPTGASMLCTPVNSIGDSEWLPSTELRRV